MQLNAYFRPEEPNNVCAWGLANVGTALPLYRHFAVWLVWSPCCLELRSPLTKVPLTRSAIKQLKQRTKCPGKRAWKSKRHAKRTNRGTHTRTHTQTHWHTRKPQGNNKFAAMRNGNVCNGNRGNAALQPLHWHSGKSRSCPLQLSHGERQTNKVIGPHKLPAERKVAGRRRWRRWPDRRIATRKGWRECEEKERVMASKFYYDHDVATSPPPPVHHFTNPLTGT